MEIKKIYNYIQTNKDMRIRPKYMHPTYKSKITFGEKASDFLTKWAGSWIFIISVSVLLMFWIFINTIWLLFGQSWDPYPFILLNFILSTLAALQAPIILMSQNRQTQKDRSSAEYDYAVNKKAEKEIQEIKKQLNKIENIIQKKLSKRK
ncbi:DUF1003 domain-containing protein [Patescibacteria group bacterium]|nr:DUF1003 domain-containing protein [Patescibacteria group bacterium]